MVAHLTLKVRPSMRPRRMVASRQCPLRGQSGKCRLSIIAG